MMESMAQDAMMAQLEAQAQFHAAAAQWDQTSNGLSATGPLTGLAPPPGLPLPPGMTLPGGATGLPMPAGMPQMPIGMPPGMPAMSSHPPMNLMGGLQSLLAPPPGMPPGPLGNLAVNSMPLPGQQQMPPMPLMPPMQFQQQQAQPQQQQQSQHDPGSFLAVPSLQPITPNAQAIAQQHKQQQNQMNAAEAMMRSRREKEEKAKKDALFKVEAAKLKCHLHNKPNKKCKFCQKLIEFTAKAQANDVKASAPQAAPGSAGDGQMARGGLLEITNTKTFGFSGLLQSHIVESKHFKSLLTLTKFEEMIKEMKDFAETIEPYMANSGTTPSGLMCCLYRLFTMGIDGQQLNQLLVSEESPYIRCIGFLYIRFGLPPDHLWSWLGEFVCDTEEFSCSKPAPGAEDTSQRLTMGEFVEGLLKEDNYYSTVLPRLPMSTKRLMETKLAPVPQYRKRTNANLALLDVYRREGIRVEINLDGEWQTGVTTELIERVPSRIKVRVRMEDSTEEIVPVGKVILTDKGFSNFTPDKKGARGRERSRSRTRTDWARTRGKNDGELVDEMRRKDRDKAVCSDKQYARKPIGFKQACALPREQGAASYKLMEEETFVSDRSRGKRSYSPEQQREEKKAPSQEHQARMQQIFEKYGMAKGKEASTSSDVDQAAVLRFGS